MEKKRSLRTTLIILVVPILLVGFLWILPFTRLLFLRLVFPPLNIPLPTLNSPSAITPANVQNVQLLEHWGNGSFETIKWSPDGNYLAVGTTFGVNLYAASTFELLQNIYLLASPTRLLAFAPDGAQLAVAGAERFITLFDIKENKIVHQWELAGPISILTYLADGGLVCVTEAGDLMRLVNGEWRSIKTLKDGFLTHVAFIPEQQAFVAVYAESTQIIDPNSGESQKLPFVIPYGGNLLISKHIRVEVDRDLSLVSSYADNKLVKQVTVDQLFDPPIPSPTGSLMATLTMNPYSTLGAVLTLWQIPSLEQVRTFRIPEASMDVGNEIAFSPDGEKVAVLATPSIVKIFSINENSHFEITLSDQFASIGDLAISPQGKLWTVNCAGTALDVMEMPSGISIDQWYFDQPTCGKLLDNGISVAIAEPYENIRIYKVHEVNNPVIVNAHCCSVFSADGRVGAGSSEVASSGDPIVIGIWQQPFGIYLKWRYHQEGYQAFKVAVSASGQYVAASSPFETHLYIRGIESGRAYPSLGANIAFSPDEKSLASAFRILDLKTGDLIELEEPGDPVCSPDSFSRPVFSPDGQILVVAACGQLRFWQTSDGALLKVLDDPYDSFELKFSPDGTFVAGRGIGNISEWGLSAFAP